MIDDRLEGGDDEFLAVASRAMQEESGAAALDALGFEEMIEHLGDPDARRAVFAAFRAQGRALAGSTALGVLLAQPYRRLLGSESGPVVAAIGRTSRVRGAVWALVGDVAGHDVSFDVDGRGLFVIPAADLDLTPVEVPGRMRITEVTVDFGAHRATVEDERLEVIRERATFLGRVAAAAEILGAAESAVAQSVEYAGLREQFGRPIGTFQALRHLLAWASTDCVAVDGVLRQCVELLDDPPVHFDAVLKALAGRNGRRACERALQALGGIGFTAEHEHHHRHSRVLLLDALLGSTSELTYDLGRWLRTSGADPRYPAGVVAAGDRSGASTDGRS